MSALLAGVERALPSSEPDRTPGRILTRFLNQHPEIQTHQDMINYCLRAGSGDWGRGQTFAHGFGLDLNILVKDRDARLRPSSSQPQPNPISTSIHTETSTRTPSGIYGNVFRRHQQHLRTLDPATAGIAPSELRHFEKVWQKNHARYEKVAQRTGVPAPLIAAIHYRESSSNFQTYLHQGDPLGRPPVHHPTRIPTFYAWEDAAVHALESKGWLRDQLSMTAATDDLSSMATYAEAYNGLGYFNRGLTSPYVYAGTNIYSGGRYVADGVFDPNSWDTRPGVIALIQLTESVT